MYIEVPDGMEEFYNSKEDTVLLLNDQFMGQNRQYFTSTRPWLTRGNVPSMRDQRQTHVSTTDGRMDD